MVVKSNAEKHKESQVLITAVLIEVCFYYIIHPLRMHLMQSLRKNLIKRRKETHISEQVENQLVASQS